ncbi:hypothetical protein HNQ80_002749 [Anaerosolibacter carboniphilus]|uniref:Copper transport outer membrane protein, MctB n=1 Tax=Anaerosolibacter carboniphilus TaxID=1417629 RepID=A0A841L2R8_9FIRM|nr:copper transporter [Anaerosolibacter carboniphilus]MBB6216645.1 hypothetical protein [Anaerosolibacter carboniphilus]
MIINLKYYVITIVAIFLAIGIGIFIGIMLDGQELIVEQQQQLVSQLESKFGDFKAKQDEQQQRIDFLNAEREKNLRFMDIAYPEMIKNKLKDLDVVIVETSEDYSYSGIAEPFGAAGVRSVTNILIKDSFLFTDDATAQEVAKDLALKGTSKDEIQKQLLRSFTDALISGNNLQLLQYLKERKMIDYSGGLTFPIDRIVVAGGSFTEAKEILNKIEVPMINIIKNSNIPIMAVEKINVAHSNIPDYKKLRISTVDNVDTIIGKASMLMVVSGQEGHFGEKETAEQLMPEEFITVE